MTKIPEYHPLSLTRMGYQAPINEPEPEKHKMPMHIVEYRRVLQYLIGSPEANNDTFSTTYSTHYQSETQKDYYLTITKENNIFSVTRTLIDHSNERLSVVKISVDEYKIDFLDPTPEIAHEEEGPLKLQILCEAALVYADLLKSDNQKTD